MMSEVTRKYRRIRLESHSIFVRNVETLDRRLRRRIGKEARSIRASSTRSYDQSLSKEAD
jgi:hypothetical protein